MAISADRLAFVDVDGIRTRYYDSGGDSGDPIVLIHGAHFGFAIPIGIEQWDLNVEALSRRGRVIAFDKLGQGYTDAPARDDEWTFGSVATHAIRFLELLNLSRITLVGHSRGGMLALHLAITRPDLIKRLVIVSSATAAPDIGAKFVNEAATLKVGQLTPDQIVSALGMAQATDRVPPENFRRFVREIAGSPKLAAEGAVLDRVEHSLWEPSLSAARDRALSYITEAGLSLPTLVLWGQNDRSAPVALGHALFDRIARKARAVACLTVINDAGHNIFIDQSQAFNAAVTGFLDQ